MSLSPRHDNDAEKLFASMEQKNARTYDVFIQSLAKVKTPEF